MGVIEEERSQVEVRLIPAGSYPPAPSRRLLPAGSDPPAHQEEKENTNILALVGVKTSEKWLSNRHLKVTTLPGSKVAVKEREQMRVVSTSRRVLESHVQECIRCVTEMCNGDVYIRCVTEMCNGDV